MELTFVPFLILAPLAAGMRAARIGRSRRAVAVRVIAMAALTALACLMAFVSWFGKHQCGE
jgi:hypothetical protein